MKRTSIVFGCTIASCLSYAQPSKSLSLNIPTASFTIEKVGIKTRIPTETTIDLRDLLDAPIPSLKVLSESWERNTFQVLDEEAISTYKLVHDSLWIYEKETPLTKRVYNQPELKLTFPLTEGKHIMGFASGKSYYADKLAFNFYSNYETSVSLSKDIVTPEGIKLNNVFRIKTTRNTSYSNLTSDSIGYTIKEEECFWYIQGELFPILYSYETAGNAKSYKSYYYVRNPLSETYGDETTEQESSAKNTKTSPTTNSLLEYESVNHEDSHEFEIAYSLKVNTIISFTVASIGGIVYQSRSYKASPNEKYTFFYNYSHLPYGEYVVRIGITNNQINIKFNVK